MSSMSSLHLALSLSFSLRSIKRVIDPRLPINRRHYPIPVYRVSRHCWRSNWFREIGVSRSHARRYCNKTRHGSREQDNFGREGMRERFLLLPFVYASDAKRTSIVKAKNDCACKKNFIMFLLFPSWQILPLTSLPRDIFEVSKSSCV